MLDINLFERPTQRPYEIIKMLPKSILHAGKMCGCW